MAEDYKDELTENQKTIFDLAMTAINDTRPDREKNLFDILIDEELERHNGITEVENIDR